MKTFIKCESCDAEVPAEHCEFATHKRIINGKEYVFCCVRCAESFEKGRKR